MKKSEPEHSIFYKIACAQDEYSDQHAHVLANQNLRCLPEITLDHWYIQYLVKTLSRLRDSESSPVHKNTVEPQ